MSHSGKCRVVPLICEKSFDEIESFQLTVHLWGIGFPIFLRTLEPRLISMLTSGYAFLPPRPFPFLSGTKNYTMISCLFLAIVFSYAWGPTLWEHRLSQSSECDIQCVPHVFYEQHECMIHLWVELGTLAKLSWISPMTVLPPVLSLYQKCVHLKIHWHEITSLSPPMMCGPEVCTHYGKPMLWDAILGQSRWYKITCNEVINLPHKFYGQGNYYW
jgi:hypothetical protein